MTERISIHLCTRDRSTEVYGFLQSLRTQQYQNWDLVIIDGSQPNTVFNLHPLQSILNRIKLEGHGVAVFMIPVQGVCAARQMALEKDPWPENPLIARLDDDTLLEPYFLQKLIDGINQGWDLVSGLTPHCASPDLMRETKFIMPIVNKLQVDNEGNVVQWGDDCAFIFDEERIIPTHHFRSSALYKRELHKDGNDYKSMGLSMKGFREEFFLSIRAILAGYKLAVHTGAKYYHLVTPSGGVRFPNEQQLAQLDEHRTRTWFAKKFKERGNFLKEYDDKFK